MANAIMWSYQTTGLVPARSVKCHFLVRGCKQSLISINAIPEIDGTNPTSGYKP